MSLETQGIADVRSDVRREVETSSLEGEILRLQMLTSVQFDQSERESPYLNRFWIDRDGDVMVFSSPQIPAENVGKLLTNEHGDRYRLNSMRQVTEYTYMDNGNAVQTITNVRRDMDGLVIEFTDRDGTNWVKQHRDPDNGKWYAKNSADASAFYVPVDLGDVTLHPDGLHIEGKDQAKVYLPSR